MGPLSCKNSTHCHWICQNMVKADGVSEKTIESDQNVKIEELEADDDQQFESDMFIVDDSDNEDLEAPEAPVVNETEPARRMLAEDTEIAMVYDEEGFEADADSYEQGVVVDDPAMAETIVVPEDSRDPDVDYSTTSEKAFSMWWFIAGGLTTIAIVAAITYVAWRELLRTRSAMRSNKRKSLMS